MRCLSVFRVREAVRESACEKIIPRVQIGLGGASYPFVEVG